jgi:hypothetical protein
VHEWLPPLVLALLVFWRTRSLVTVAPAYAYLGYVLLDYFAIPQRRITKRLRNASPVLFFLGFGPVVLRVLALPPAAAPEALAAMVAGAFFPYLYERGTTALGFVSGFVMAACLEIAALVVAPSPLGPHFALLVFAAAYAWERHTVFWRYSVPVLVAYLVVLGRFAGAGRELLPHVAAGLLGWLLARFVPVGSSAPPPEPPQRAVRSGLGLMDD